MAARKVGSSGQGSPGDIRDRFRDVYKPGKNAPKEGPKKMPLPKEEFPGEHAIKKKIKERQAVVRTVRNLRRQRGD